MHNFLGCPCNIWNIRILKKIFEYLKSKLHWASRALSGSPHPLPPLGASPCPSTSTLLHCFQNKHLEDQALISKSLWLKWITFICQKLKIGNQWTRTKESWARGSGGNGRAFREGSLAQSEAWSTAVLNPGCRSGARKNTTTGSHLGVGNFLSSCDDST